MREVDACCINSLPTSLFSSTVSDFLPFLYGTANDLLMSQRLTTSTSRKDVLVHGDDDMSLFLSSVDIPVCFGSLF
jgi:hypothetical protein